MAWIFTSDGNYVNFNGGGNLWRLHKDSACISWHWDESGDLFFDVYGQEYTVKAANIADVVINGTPLSAASGFPAAIQAVFTGLYAPGGDSGYLVYTALINQSGSSAPVATVIQNTLGGTVVWSRYGAGGYNATLAGAFTANKTFFSITASEPTGIAGGRQDADNMYVQTFDTITGNAQDGVMTEVSVEIRVYPE